MDSPKHIQTEHKDIIHDVSFDYYGKRMATCSSDHTVKIWDLVNGEWKCTADWRTHSGSVWKVTWAHPEFGQVIATCSFDRTAVVWEERVAEVNNPLHQSKSQWTDRVKLGYSSVSVTDIKFAPKDLGLFLAMCYKDGGCRIYEATDVMELSNWSEQHSIEGKLTTASCISWNPSRSIAPMLAVGSDDPNLNAGPKVEIHILNNNNRKWGKVATLDIQDAVHDICFAPNVGRSRHLLAIASKDIYIATIKPMKQLSENMLNEKPIVEMVAVLTDHESQVWRVDWNITGTLLASTGDDGRVRLWKGNYMDKWKCLPAWHGDGSSNTMLTRPPSNSISQGQSVLAMTTQKGYPMY